MTRPTDVSMAMAVLSMAAACAQSTPESTKTAAAGEAPTPTAAPSAAAGAAEASTKTAKDAAEPAVPEDPWQRTLASRTLAASGLDVGSRLSAFDIVNAETGERYCQVCRFGPSPKVMLVGTVDDEAFHEDVRNLDAVAKKYADAGLGAFAVVTALRDGKAITPTDAETARRAADAMRAGLDVTIPIVVPAPDDDGTNRVWDEYYNVTASRTWMFADGTNEVKYSAVGPKDLSGLDAAIRQVVDAS